MSPPFLSHLMRLIQRQWGWGEGPVRLLRNDPSGRPQIPALAFLQGISKISARLFGKALELRDRLRVRFGDIGPLARIRGEVK